SQLKDVDGQLKNVKSLLGIDKVTRDKESGRGSVSAYIDTLLTRAKQFGILRNNQVQEIMDIFAELEAKITFADNATEDERREFKIEFKTPLPDGRDEVNTDYEGIILWLK